MIVGEVVPTSQPGKAPPPSRRVLRVVGGVVGLLLIAAAITAIVRQQDALLAAWHHARNGGPTTALLALALLALPLVSCALASVMYWLLMNTRAQPGRVGLLEMLALIASTWLLNYLPLRPGMVGRLAYHATVNKIPLHEGVARSVMALSAGAVSVVLLVAAALLARQAGGGPLVAVVCLVGPVVGIGALAGLASLQPRGDATRRYALACAVRYLDVLSWMARYLAAFAIIGRPLTLMEAVAFTAVSQAAMAVPFVSNGLGLREWAVGLLAPLLPAWTRATPLGAAPLSATLALTADVLHRAADVLVALPAGMWGAWYLARLQTRRAGE